MIDMAVYYAESLTDKSNHLSTILDFKITMFSENNHKYIRSVGINYFV